MKATVCKSDVKGSVSAPSSKSYTIRGLMCAALARGESLIVRPLDSDDTSAAIDVLKDIGVGIQWDSDICRITGGSFRVPEGDMFCHDSAATLRFMTAICSLVPGYCRLTAGPSLGKRPVGQLIQTLRQIGVDCSSRGDLPPVIVNGGRLKGGKAELSGDISSQFISALLLIAPLADEGVKIRLTTPLRSRPYIFMTMNCMEKFGIRIKHNAPMDELVIEKQVYHPAKYQVEGDWSSASYLLAAGALAGDIEVRNLKRESLQGDKVLLKFLKDMGASVAENSGSVRVKKSKLRAIKADLSDCIDLLPTMSVLAAAADGTSEFKGIERARIKESDRVSAVQEGLQKMGIKVVADKDKLAVTGGIPVAAEIDSRNDHRIAMAFSILGLLCEDTVIDGAECVSKTYPEFWKVLRNLGARVKIND